MLELESQHVHFRSLTGSIDTKTPAGRFFFHVMASLSQMERELVIERTRAGLNAARKQGRVGGRKRLMTEKKMFAARKLLAGGSRPEKLRRISGSLCRRFTDGYPPAVPRMKERRTPNSAETSRFEGTESLYNQEGPH